MHCCLAGSPKRLYTETVFGNGLAIIRTVSVSVILTDAVFLVLCESAQVDVCRNLS